MHLRFPAPALSNHGPVLDLNGFQSTLILILEDEPSILAAEPRPLRMIFPPSFRYASFDNVGVSILVVLYSFTTSGWTDVMYQAMDVLGPGVWVYFCAVVTVLSWFASTVDLAGARPAPAPNFIRLTPLLLPHASHLYLFLLLRRPFSQTNYY